MGRVAYTVHEFIFKNADVAANTWKQNSFKSLHSKGAEKQLESLREPTPYRFSQPVCGEEVGKGGEPGQYRLNTLTSWVVLILVWKMKNEIREEEKGGGNIVLKKLYQEKIANPFLGLLRSKERGETPCNMEIHFFILWASKHEV